MSDVPSLLQPLKDRLAKITPGPWQVDRNYPFSQDLVGIFAKDEQRYVLQVENQDDVDDPTCDEDADFIAHAPTDQAKLIAAVEAITTLHKPERRWMPYEGAGISFDTEAEALAALEDVDVNSVVVDDLAANGTPFFEVCSHCKVIEDSPCDGQCTLEAGYCESEWPCKTVAALTQALGGDTA
ncbi:hypothetical protein [Paenarthrobacter ureafaciens]|uniref:hypothetical protein n=1 Tax=Paenarthrobacter ureafaciens TaxID=37931 RepID=UPI0009ADA17C|nr:hypothetical protein [Paenarthrobacter ureafaciens]GLU58596.1 hypothetical protein Pure01_11090 [Paenarthrobacter ureafaciens]GLU61841.1 hypothetical protein Pure02_00910 [Paenarthrobacter ureafaciens]GLU66115.1 hypothetical protein Pure03_00910 [Paenarthrobacter ureafaciens]GLU71561.1 hypothetical protein Pure04_12760 [Paenarthrobacter ureafaciens]GLU74652.1 hypothetical protein Pure05_00920 [Paenarthrobacter ureafaciens]